MSPARAAAIGGRILRQFRHDRRTLALIVIVPLVVVALIGYLVGDEGREPLPVAVVNLDTGAETPAGRISLGSTIAEALAQDGSIAVRSIGSEAAATEDVRSDEVAGAVVIPADLTSTVLAGGSARVRVVVGGVNPALQGPVLEATQRALAALAGSAPQAGFRAPPVSVEPVVLVGGVHLSALDYDAPVLVAFFAFFLTFLLTSVSFLRERSSGTLERLMASPVSRLEVLLGYLLGFIGFAMAQALLLLGYEMWVLDVRVVGSIWLVLLILAILVIGVVNLGIALSFYARNELQVVQFIPLVFTPQALLGGLVWPVETLHPALRWLSQVFPLTHATVALRSVMVGGAGIEEVAPRLAALTAFSGAMVLLGILALRKQRA